MSPLHTQWHKTTHKCSILNMKTIYPTLCIVSKIITLDMLHRTLYYLYFNIAYFIHHIMPLQNSKLWLQIIKYTLSLVPPYQLMFSKSRFIVLFTWVLHLKTFHQCEHLDLTWEHSNVVHHNESYLLIF